MPLHFPLLRKRILALLAKEIDPRLTYHNVRHTREVLEDAERIAAAEGFTHSDELLLLKVAALYHDTGFLFTYANHEEQSCAFARRDLQRSGFSPEQLDRICSIIMATKIPQSPVDPLEQVICDADLDYLGREDFEPISNSLKLEFLEFGVVTTESEWEQKQIHFMEAHHYFTKTSQQLRAPRKAERLADLRERLAVFTNK